MASGSAIFFSVVPICPIWPPGLLAAPDGVLSRAGKRSLEGRLTAVAANSLIFGLSRIIVPTTIYREKTLSSFIFLISLNNYEFFNNDCQQKYIVEKNLN